MRNNVFDGIAFVILWMMFLVILSSRPAGAGVVRHIVATGGITSGNALTEGTGWTWQWGVSSSNTTLQAGDTVYVHGDSLMIDNGDGGSSLNKITKAGTAAAPIVYRAAPPEHVVLYSDVTPAPWVVVTLQGKHVEIRDFDIVHTHPSATDAAALVSIEADSCRVINNVIHDALSVGINDYSAHGSIVAGNIMSFHGRQTQIGQHGYAGYVQNKGTSADDADDGPKKTWRDNFWFSEWNLGVQFYGSVASSIANLDILRNVMFNTGNLPDDVGVEKFSYNIIVGPGETGVSAISDTIIGNLGWYNTVPTTNQIYNFGYNGDAMSLMRIDSNVFVSNDAATGVEFTAGTSMAFVGNIIVGGITGGIEGSFPTNTYLTRAEAGLRDDDVYIYANPYEAKRANVVIYNWDQSATVSFNPSSILSVGDTYIVRSATNFYEDTLATGTYSGSAITVTCTDLTMGTPIGSFDNAPRNPAPDFIPMVLIGTAGATGRRIQFIRGG